MTKKNTTVATSEEGEKSAVNLGVLTTQPTVKRKPVKTKLADGTSRTDY